MLGENGAGKTTLMNVLYGLYHPDAGQITVRGQSVTFRSPTDAIACGIGMVHQAFRLIPNLTVAENVVLGLPSDKPLLDIAATSKTIADLAKRYKLDVDPLTPVWQLSAGKQQQVEILKALYRQVQILILDEPTSVLTPFETEGLFACVEQMAAEGYSVVFISHKLGEVMSASHRISVIRDGKLLTTVDRDTVTQNDLARMMVGREVVFRLEKPALAPGEVLLEVNGLGAKSDTGLQAVHDLSLSVRRNEVLGIAGVAGNGQNELVEALNGMRPTTSGEVRLAGRPITHLDPGKISQRGVAFIPGKARQVAVLNSFSIEDNTALKVLQHAALSPGAVPEPARHRSARRTGCLKRTTCARPIVTWPPASSRAATCRRWSWRLSWCVIPNSSSRWTRLRALTSAPQKIFTSVCWRSVAAARQSC